MKKFFLIAFLVGAQFTWAQHRFTLSPLSPAQAVQTAGTLGVMVVEGTHLLVYAQDHTLLLNYPLATADPIRYDYVDHTVTMGSESMDIVDDLLANEASKVVVYREGNQLTITGAPAGSPIRLYSVGGQLLSAKTMPEEELILSLEAQAHGTYLLIVANQVFKIQ